MRELEIFIEVMEKMERDKRFDKLEDYQKYQLALEIMKSKISPGVFTANEEIFPDSSNDILSAGDVCAVLKIKESTLRKYALILQDVGYHFQTNNQGQRSYYNQDVIAIKKLIEIKQAPDMTLEQAANTVISWIKQRKI